MANASFRVVQAGPLVSFQDAGRPGNMRFGVSASGPMDKLSFTSANLAVGNFETATTVEISMGGLVLECISGRITIAIAGGGFQVECGKTKNNSGTVITIEVGQKLSIRPGSWGSWCYLAFAGRISARQWLGRTATHAMSGFGGGLLTAGQIFEVEEAKVVEDREGVISPFDVKPFSGYVRIVLGPQDQYFTKDAKKQLLSAEFTLSDAYDRMGVRLNGPALNLDGSLSIPSEPIIKGSVQVSGDGVPTILLADHQSTGGYPKIATVISTDIDDFVQLRPRNTFRFKAIEPKSAVTLARTRAIELRSYFEDLKKPKGTLAQRLMSENLISGVFS